jgi:transglutaminase-like putative cysteine protease
MRLRIAHRNDYQFDPPATGVIQMLRLTPRNHEGQYLVRWRIDVSANTRLASHDDAFGNITHVFTADGPLDKLCVEVDGEVETQNTDGLVRGTFERFGPSLFLRDTALTQADTAIQAFAQSVRATKSGEILAELHMLLDRLYEDMAHDADDSQSAANAAESYARKHGTARDLSHIFIGAAHHLGIPARYVSGYFCRDDEAAVRQAGHAWVEAFVSDLGWVAFDPANGFCPTDGHVRVALGLDWLGAAPIRRMHYGPAAESLAVAIKVGQ